MVGKNIVPIVASPSVRGRGLKPDSTVTVSADGPVALRAGAWIEPANVDLMVEYGKVALRAGAWIETFLFRAP